MWRRVTDRWYLGQSCGDGAHGEHDECQDGGNCRDQGCWKVLLLDTLVNQLQDPYLLRSSGSQMSKVDSKCCSCCCNLGYETDHLTTALKLEEGWHLHLDQSCPQCHHPPPATVRSTLGGTLGTRGGAMGTLATLGGIRGPLGTLRGIGGGHHLELRHCSDHHCHDTITRCS